MELKEKFYSVIAIIAYILCVVSYFGMIIAGKKLNGKKYQVGFTITFVISMIGIGVYIGHGIYLAYK